jgi:hypothetical protein
MRLLRRGTLAPGTEQVTFAQDDLGTIGERFRRVRTTVESPPQRGTSSLDITPRRRRPPAATRQRQPTAAQGPPAPVAPYLRWVSLGGSALAPGR